MLCRIEKGKARLVSRNGKDWTAVFASVADDLAKLPVRDAWIDGEVVVLDSAGRTSFSALQNALTATSGFAVSFFAFDVLFLDGYDLRSAALTDRRLCCVESSDGTGAIRVGPEIPGMAKSFRAGLQAGARRRDLEACGLALPRRCPYTRLGEVKCTRRQEMVIGGFTDPQGSRKGFGALLLGIYESGQASIFRQGSDRIRPAGRSTRSTSCCSRSEQDKPAFANPPRGYEAKGRALWSADSRVDGNSAFTDGATTASLAPSVVPGDCARTRKRPMWGRARGARRRDVGAAEKRPSTAAARNSSPTTVAKHQSAKAPSAKVSPSAKAAKPVAAVPISSPDKVVLSGSRHHEARSAQYFERIAPRIVPHVANRPCRSSGARTAGRAMLLPEARRQKRQSRVDRIEVPEGNGTATYMGARNAKALSHCCNGACWNCIPGDRARRGSIVPTA
jgi:bifunctional non-homologous end joining protein LigD